MTVLHFQRLILSVALQDFDLLTVEHGVAIDRNACVFCHVGIYRNGAFTIDQACPTCTRA